MMIGGSILTSASVLHSLSLTLISGKKSLKSSFTCESSSQVDGIFGAQDMNGREEIFSVNAEVVGNRTITIE